MFNAIMKASILIVDDEEIIRNFAAHALERLGYTVSRCSNGLEAVEWMTQRADEVDLVVLDLIMPKLSGKDTFYRLREMAPTIPIVIASGFTQTEAVSELLHDGAVGFLSKPFRLEDLSREAAKHVGRKQGTES